MSFKTILKWLPKWLLVALLVATVISSFDGVILATATATIADFNRNSTAGQIILFIMLSVGAWIIVYVAMAVREALLNNAIKRLNTKLKENFIYQQLLSAHLATDAADNVSKLFNDFKLVETNYYRAAFNLVVDLAMAVVSAVYILWQNFSLGLIFIVFSTLPMLTPKLFGKVNIKASSNWQSASSIFTGKVTDLFRGLHTVKTYLAEKTVYQDTDHYLKRMEISYQTMNNWQAVALGVSAILSTLSFMIPTGIGLLMMIKGQTTVSSVLAIYMATDRVVGPLRGCAQYLNQMKTTTNIRMNLHDQIIKFSPQPVIVQTSKPQINFVNVSFTYRNNRKILQNLTLKLPYGSKVLITGASGVGKSTLLNLIQGFIRPTTGQLYLEDNFGKTTELLKSGLIAYIQQSPYLFNDTLRFNLTLGEEFTDEACQKVLKQVGLSNELGIGALDKSYGEAGKELSGGQRQRVEIARALLFNKKIILLDEATSNLDLQMTQKVRMVIHQLPCTVIEVAHHYDEGEVQQFGFKHYELAGQRLQKV
ncbi:ABC transporter ATP-binding protein [Lactobacillus sp. ESL0791]|uniref:ATP-binding cassette domain-containing protein n=1 Tax=Lactobacillus sp. ESL0791 TaxID=2983234 RepID=UPI0023F6E6D3|nr:ABC transporter ATP-binding protein [Lactobacillus sp. ESL0791]MDF7639863.1 ABC transporter ATP-binding protein [Lactobacillus sp. ESL0791]